MPKNCCHLLATLCLVLPAACTVAPLETLSGLSCAADGGCLEGYTCDEQTMVCVTTGDACGTEGQVSPCAFGAQDCTGEGCRTCTDGQWSECVPATCQPTTEIPCNGIDDDCVDGDLQETGTLANCSGCGDNCSALEQVASATCNTSGATPACVIQACNLGFADIDGQPGNGCESTCTITNGGVEICDGVDNDCNGTSDDAAEGAAFCTDYYRDVDADTYGVTGDSECRCNPTGAYTASQENDCDDNSDLTFPGAAPNDDVSACMKDADGDDWGDDSPPASVSAGTDCDDALDTVHPGASEAVNDGIDQDCNRRDQCFEDTDTDGYGSTVLVDDVDLDLDCSTGSGVSTVSTDCDDSSATTFPGAAPNDDGSACMKDDDLDDFGDSNPPLGVTPGSDCSDAMTGVNPGATDDPGDDGDENCSGFVVCFDDSDADGHGAPTYGESSFAATNGVADTAGACGSNDSDAWDDTNDDCDDAKVGCWSTCVDDLDGDDYCDADAGDCDDTAATGASCHLAIDCSTYYRDADTDTYGDSGTTHQQCAPGGGYVANDLDCDDSHSNAWDTCATCVDSDADTHYLLCNTYAGINGPDCDDGKVGCWSTCTDDLDGDDYCDSDAGDCDDTAATGASCHLAIDCSTYYRDADGDTYGDSGVFREQCVAGGGYIADNTDCDDTDPDNWVSCATCLDADGDTYYLGCDAYTMRNGPDTCPRFDDALDWDGDSTPDGCDECQGWEPVGQACNLGDCDWRCNGTGACVAGSSNAGEACDGGDSLWCNSSCDGGGTCTLGAPSCDDNCACTSDTCVEPPPAAACHHDFAAPGTCSLAANNSGPASERALARVTVDIDCIGQVSRIRCSTSAARLCINTPERFETDLGAFTGTRIEIRNCGQDSVSATNCPDDDGGNPDVMRLMDDGTSNALITGIDASGFTDLQVHFMAAFGPGSDPDENIDVSACCDSGSGCTPASVGSANNGDSGGVDAWTERGPMTLTAATYDNCPDVSVALTYVTSGNDEDAHVDNFTVSGTGSLTIPLVDNGDGTYSGSFAACEATTVTVTCDWDTPDGTFTDSTAVQFN